MLDDRDHVADQLVGLVVFDALGLTAQVVAALVDRHDMEVFRELGHLGAPGIPEVGEAVDHDDQRILFAAQADIVNLDPAGIDKSVFGTGQETRGRGRGLGSRLIGTRPELRSNTASPRPAPARA